MTERDALLRAVAADPADDTPRLVFADFLDEQDNEPDAAWAEYIRLSVKLARPQWPECVPMCEGDDDGVKRCHRSCGRWAYGHQLDADKKRRDEIRTDSLVGHIASGLLMSRCRQCNGVPPVTGNRCPVCTGTGSRFSVSLGRGFVDGFGVLRDELHTWDTYPEGERYYDVLRHYPIENVWIRGLSPEYPRHGPFARGGPFAGMCCWSHTTWSGVPALVWRRLDGQVGDDENGMAVRKVYSSVFEAQKAMTRAMLGVFKKWLSLAEGVTV